jgi:hypothetical protein
MKLTSDLIKCPAGTLVSETIQGPGCRCRITQETLTRVENSHSLQNFCAGKYGECPVWRREKEEIAARKEKEFQKAINQSALTSPDRPT